MRGCANKGFWFSVDWGNSAAKYLDKPIIIVVRNNADRHDGGTISFHLHTYVPLPGVESVMGTLVVNKLSKVRDLLKGLNEIVAIELDLPNQHYEPYLERGKQT